MLRRALAIQVPRVTPANTAGGFLPRRLQREARLVLEEVRGLEVANGVSLGAHHHRLGRRAALEEADALEEVAGGDARRREDHRALRHLVDRVDPIRIRDAHLARALDLLLVAE